MGVQSVQIAELAVLLLRPADEEQKLADLPRRTNGVCWIIRYLRRNNTSQGTRGLHPHPAKAPWTSKKHHEPSCFLTVELAALFLTRTRRKKNIKRAITFLLFLMVLLRDLQGSWSPLQSAQSETIRKNFPNISFRLNRGEKLEFVPLQFELVI